MFINPKHAIQNSWITGIVDVDKQTQPNAIDFTIDNLFTILDTECVISEDGKIMRSTESVTVDTSGFWKLAGRTTYDAMSSMYIEVPEGVACLLIVRSTFNRNGIFITSGLYDSGYKGHIGFAVHNQSRAPAMIKPGTRVGQVIFVASENAGIYAGGYNHGQNTHWTEKS